jgi:hypothetical protein
MRQDLQGFCIGVLTGAFALGIYCSFFAQNTKMYRDGVEATYKEAFAQGLMVKEITEDDKVIYRFIETHKIGYDGEQ